MDIDILRSHLLNYGLIFGDTVNNKRYNMFVDTREALQKSGVLGIAGRLLWNKIKKYQPEVIVGQGLGASNLLIATQIAAEIDQYKLSTLIVRDKRKSRNRQKLVEGPSVRTFARAVYIDDVFNSGNTYRKCLKNLLEDNIQLDIMAVAILYDFWKPYGSRRLEILGTPVERVFTRHDLGLTRIDPKDQPIYDKILWRNFAYNRWPKWIKSKPTFYDNKVIFANDRHEVFCHEIETGEILWHWQGRFPRQEKGIASQLVVDNDKLYFSSYDGFSYCLDILTGLEVWSNRLDYFLHSTPCIDRSNNELYLGTEGGLSYGRGDIVCQDLETGKTKWRVPTRHVIPASPAIFKKQIICGSNDGYLYSVTAGKLNWSIYVGVVKGRPSVVKDNIFVSTEDGKIICINEFGQVIWHRTCGVESIHQFLPTHESGLIFTVNQESQCIAYDLQGNQVWVRTLRGAALYNISLFRDELLIVTQTGYAVILNALTGKKIKQSFLNYRVNCPAEFNEKYIAVHTLTQGMIVFKR